MKLVQLLTLLHHSHQADHHPHTIPQVEQLWHLITCSNPFLASRSKTRNWLYRYIINLDFHVFDPSFQIRAIGAHAARGSQLRLEGLDSLQKFSFPFPSFGSQLGQLLTPSDNRSRLSLNRNYFLSSLDLRCSHCLRSFNTHVLFTGL